MKMTATTASARTLSGELLTWDSEFWQARIGRGDSPLLDEWARDNTIGCMCLLIPARDQAEIHAAEERGFRVMDVRVRYERETAPQIGIARPATASNLDELAAIARTAFRGLTRFYADPRFEDSRCDDLYENWLRENFADPAVEVLMVGDGGGAAGFVTVRMEPAEASIVLIAADDRVRGKGIGANLVRAATHLAHVLDVPKISVVTQGCNVPAQRCFQQAGFVLTSTDVWLHKWYL